MTSSTFDGEPLSERDQAAVDAFASFLRSQPPRAREEYAVTPPESERRPFCGTWPFPTSDLDIASEADNVAVHRARGCCDGWEVSDGRG